MSKKNTSNEKPQASLATTRALTIRFFQMVLERQFAEAERILERLKTKARKNEWDRGYIWALNGIVLAQKSGEERYAFLTNLDLNDEKELERNRRELLEHVKSDFHAEYDRGFFSAWADFLRTILKTRQTVKQAGQAG